MKHGVLPGENPESQFGAATDALLNYFFTSPGRLLPGDFYFATNSLIDSLQERSTNIFRAFVADDFLATNSLIVCLRRRCTNKFRAFVAGDFLPLIH